MNDKVVSINGAASLDTEAAARRRALTDWVLSGMELFEQREAKAVTAIVTVIIADDGTSHTIHHSEESTLMPSACFSIALGAIVANKKPAVSLL
jgi:hypothetical protein